MISILYRFLRGNPRPHPNRTRAAATIEALLLKTGAEAWLIDCILQAAEARKHELVGDLLDSIALTVESEAAIDALYEANCWLDTYPYIPQGR